MQIFLPGQDHRKGLRRRKQKGRLTRYSCHSRLTEKGFSEIGLGELRTRLSLTSHCASPSLILGCSSQDSSASQTWTKGFPNKGPPVLILSFESNSNTLAASFHGMGRKAEFPTDPFREAVQGWVGTPEQTDLSPSAAHGGGRREPCPAQVLTESRLKQSYRKGYG